MGTKTHLRALKFQIIALGAALAIAATTSSLFGQEAYSQARIVRLSFTQGEVSIERPGSAQWEAAPVNTPIQQGFKLSTATGGYAEVQFENSSTVRLGEQSELDFTRLALAPDGSKINHMELVSGYATFTVLPEGNASYAVNADGATLTPSRNSQFRVDLDQSVERVEVFKGQVSVTSPDGSAQLAKDDVLEIEPGASQAFVQTHGITLDSWDKWVDSRQQVLMAQYNRGGSQTYNPYPQYASMWGWNELSYYGSWNYIPGVGYGWGPNLGCGFTPFTSGQWAWYPSFGWTWVSYQPWGWLPYHYGYWDFISGSGCGWYWFPGGFNAWSPGLVTWVQGNNWVGWYPRIPSGRGRGPACAHGRPCMVAVSSSTFRRGGMISPGDLLNLDPSHGHIVTRPSVAPQSGPGLARGGVRVRPEPVGTSPSRARVIGGSGIAVLGPRRAHFGGTAPSVVLSPVVSEVLKKPAKSGGLGSAGSSSGIIFDSRTGRFVNNPNARPSEVSGGAPAGGQAASNPRSAAESGAKRPTPTPGPAVQSPGHHFNFFGLFDHHNSPETGGGQASPRRGSPARMGSSTANGGSSPQPRAPSTSAPRQAPVMSAPRQAPVMSAPRSEPSFHSAPPPSSPPSGGGGGAHTGGARTPH